MPSLRIAIFAPYDLARDGGVTNQIRAQARALRRLGHKVLVYGPASAPLPNGEIAIGRSHSLTLHGTESGMALGPVSAWRAAHVVRTEPFDVLHVHEPLTPLAPWVALRFATAPIVGTFHVYREDGHRLYPLGRPLLNSLIRRLAYRIAVSDAARRTVARHFPGEYEIVPNAIDLDEFAAPRPRPQTVASNRCHVLYIGRLEPRKGVAYLVQAMGKLRQTVPNARLLVAGDGPDRARLTALARECRADVTFLGRVANPDLPAYIQASDLVCSPALGGESFGVVLLEAMACGRPVVASRIDGYVGLIGDVGCGTLVPPGDVDGLEQALRPLLQDADLRQTLGARGAEAARAYDSLAIARRLDAIYQRLQPSV